MEHSPMRGTWLPQPGIEVHACSLSFWPKSQKLFMPCRAGAFHIVSPIHFFTFWYETEIGLVQQAKSKKTTA